MKYFLKYSRDKYIQLQPNEDIIDLKRLYVMKIKSNSYLIIRPSLLQVLYYRSKAREWLPVESLNNACLSLCIGAGLDEIDIH